MKYIDLDKGLYKDPMSKDVLRCEIRGGLCDDYHLAILDGYLADNRPFALLDLRKHSDIMEWLSRHDLYPRTCSSNVPYFEDYNDVRCMCDALNKDLNKKYGTNNGFETIVLEFE